MTPHDSPSFLDEQGHVPAAEMARYIDGTCDRTARSSVTHHVANCKECREELTALRRLVPNRSRMTVRLGTLLSAAAAVTLITLSWRGTTATRTDEFLSRSTQAGNGVPEIDLPFPVASPTAGQVISADSVRLTWHVAGPDAAYDVLLQDEGGGIVYASTTSDTSAVVPPTAFATRAARASGDSAHLYYWSVEARLLDGRSARTGVYRVRIR